MSGLSSLVVFRIPYITGIFKRIEEDSLGYKWSVNLVPLNYKDWQISLECQHSTPDLVTGIILLIPRMQYQFPHLRFNKVGLNSFVSEYKALSVADSNKNIFLFVTSFYEQKMIPKSAPDTNVAKPNETLLQITNQLSEDMLTLLRKEYFTDVSLRCGSELFRVHRSILTARSPVFSAMFHSTMKESQEDSVNIGDMDPEILSAMLEYLYSGKTALVSDSKACALLSASDMYQLEGLKKACADFLISSMNMDNVLRIFVVSDLYNEESLKSSAVSYICENFDSLESKEEWLALQKENPSLVIEVMSAKIKRLKTK